MEETYHSNTALLEKMDSSMVDLENEGGMLNQVLSKHHQHYEENEMQELEKIKPKRKSLLNKI